MLLESWKKDPKDYLKELLLEARAKRIS